MTKTDIGMHNLCRWVDSTYEGGKRWSEFCHEVLCYVYPDHVPQAIWELDADRQRVFLDWIRSQEE